MSSKTYDVTVIGGGIVGLGAARAVARRFRARVVVLEAESRLAAHQTGNNSGVIHSGLYYKPGSLKAQNCTAGRDAMYRFCERHDIPHERCGKVVVAIEAEEIPRLEELERRGRANGLEGLRRLDEEGLRQIEPHCRAVAALQVPQTGIVDFTRVAEAIGQEVREHDGEIRTDSRVLGVRRDADGFVLNTASGDVPTRNLINCAGLHCDRIARMCGLRPDVRIVPFRGEYWKLRTDKEHLVNHLIYPVPDPRFPFLGVHFTRMIAGGIEAGPNAVLALKREGYSRTSFSPGDALGTLSYGGFWKLAARYWRVGAGEFYRSFSIKATERALQALVPELAHGDLERHGAGVRAQAVRPDGALVDDFHILDGERMLHVLNAPSPAATASLSIGETLAARAAESFGLAERSRTGAAAGGVTE